MSRAAPDPRREQAALWRARLAEQPDLALSPEYLDWCADEDNRALQPHGSFASGDSVHELVYSGRRLHGRETE